MGDTLVSVAAKLKPAAKGAPSIDGVLSMASGNQDVHLISSLWLRHGIMMVVLIGMEFGIPVSILWLLCENFGRD